MTLKRYNATVSANNDDELRGRIRVTCAGLMGDEDTEVPQWVDPVFEWGWFFVPDVGEIVEVEVTESDDDDESFGQATIDSLDLHWRGKRIWTEDVTEEGIEPRPIPEDMQTNYGKRRGFVTPAGHVLMFDDTAGEEQVRLSWHRKEGQEDKYQYMAMDGEGSTVIANKNGSYVYLDAEHGAASMVDEHGNSISMDDKGIKAIDKFSNIIELKDGAVQVLGQDAIIISSKTCNIKSGTINLLDGADAPLLRGTDVKAYLESHQHAFVGLAPGTPGTTAVPITPLPPTALSQQCKVK